MAADLVIAVSQCCDTWGQAGPLTSRCSEDRGPGREGTAGAKAPRGHRRDVFGPHNWQAPILSLLLTVTLGGHLSVLPRPQGSLSGTPGEQDGAGQGKESGTKGKGGRRQAVVWLISLRGDNGGPGRGRHVLHLPTHGCWI